jgi:nucleoside-diphosphate-sugar epimerase
MRILITGATGFVGGHLVEACQRRGWQVVALARPRSDTKALEAAGVAVVRCEPTDAAALRKAVAEIDAIVNCAAKIGDWGPHEDYIQANVDNLRVLLDACKGQALSRFVHLSSLGVYAAKHHYGTDETTPAATSHRDGYSHSKALAERLVLQYERDFGVPAVVLRPGFIYGPRDKTVMPRIIDTLRQKAMRYPGAKGARALNTIFVRNLIDAIFLAIASDRAVGQIYNLTDGEMVSKRRFIETIADAMGCSRPTLTPPLWLAWLVTWTADKAARLRGSSEGPAFSFPRLKFMGLNLDFSIEKAKRELGYSPRYTFDDAMSETMGWYRAGGDGVGV